MTYRIEHAAEDALELLDSALERLDDPNVGRWDTHEATKDVRAARDALRAATEEADR